MKQNFIRLVLIILMFMTMCLTCCNATTWYVKQNSSSPYTGDSWTNAFTTIDAALANQNLASGDEIWVAGGESTGVTYTSQSGEFEVPEGVKLFGGFEGSETFLAQRNWHTYKTILNSTYVSASSSATDDGAIDGFTITGLNSSEYMDILLSGEVTFSHNIVINCTGHWHNYFLMCSGPVNVVNNLIAGNSITDYVVIYCDGACKIINNTISQYNECQTIFCGSSTQISNNIIVNNCGIQVFDSAAPALYNNCLYGCAALGDYLCFPEEWTPPVTEMVEVDPLLTEDYHRQNNSPCTDSGSDDVVMDLGAYDNINNNDIPEFAMLKDLDCRARVQGNHVDRGAYETDGTGTDVNASADTLTLLADPPVAYVGQTVAITANVKDAAANNISGRAVYFSQTGGDPPAAGLDTTDGSGNADWTVSRSTPGKVTVTAFEDMPCGFRVTATIDVWFFEGITPSGCDDWPMFMHDPQHTGMSKTWDISGETLSREWVVDLPTASTIRDSDWSYFDGQDTISHPNPAGFGTFIFQHPYTDSSPVVVDNKVVVGTWTRGTNYPFPGEQSPATGSVEAFDADDGDPAWPSQRTYTPSMGGVASTPCISGGKVYVGTTNGYLYCLDLSDGSQVWASQTTNRSATPGSSPIISSPVVYGENVYITNEASKIYAFDADDGTLVTGYPIALPIDQSGHGDNGNGVTDVRQQNICGASSAAVATVGINTYLLVGCDDGYLYRINLNNWTTDGLYMDGCVESSPSVSGNNAYIGVSIYGGQNVRRVTIEPFAEIANWMLGWPNSEESRATVSLAYDFAYNGLDTGHQFFKLDANATGSDNIWLAEFSCEYPDNYFVGSAAHTTGGIVYTGNDDGYFYALDADDLSEIVLGGYYDNTIQEPGFICSSPAIAYNVDANHNRWVFITTRADGGKLYAFETER